MLLCVSYYSLVELLQGGTGGLSVLRTFRLLRILKLVRFLPALRYQLFVMLKTMDNVATFFALLVLFIFIFRYFIHSKLRHILSLTGLLSYVLDHAGVHDQDGFIFFKWNFRISEKLGPIKICRWSQILVIERCWSIFFLKFIE